MFLSVYSWSSLLVLYHEERHYDYTRSMIPYVQTSQLKLFHSVKVRYAFLYYIKAINSHNNNLQMDMAPFHRMLITAFFVCRKARYIE